jgi:undecaprenyl-diphosphatase
VRPAWLLGAVAVAGVALVRRRRLGRVQLALAAVLAAGCALYGAGVVDLPSLERVLADVGRALGPWTYLVVGVGAFLETAAFVGLVAPGESLIVFGGFVAGQGEIELGWLLAIVWSCAVAGDSVSFFLGRRLGREFLVRHGPRFKITEERLEQVERFFARYGGRTIFVGRFVGIVRAVAPFLAGASGMPYARFWPYDVLGAGIYGTVFVLLGYVFWQSFDRVVELAGQGAFALGTVIAVVVGAVAALRYLRVREHRALLARRLDELGTRPVVGPLARAVRPTWRRVVLPAARAAATPARFVRERLTPGELGLELTTLLAVFAVGAFSFLLLTTTLDGAGITRGDVEVLGLAERLRGAVVEEAARVVSLAGAPAVVAPLAVLAAAVLAARGHVVEGAVLLAGLAVVALAVPIVQEEMSRPRPVQPLVATSEGAGFPSAQAAFAVAYVAIAVALARGVPWLAGRLAVVLAAVLLAVAVGAARIVLRAAFLTDVAAGFGLAAAVFAACGVVGLVVNHLRNNVTSPPRRA